MIDLPPWCGARRLTAVGLPVLLIATILVADVIEGPKTAFVGLLAVAPMLSAVFGAPRCAAVVGGVALIAAWQFGHHAEDGHAAAQKVRLVAIALFTIVAVGAAAARARAEARAQRADVVVAAVAAALVRPLPPLIAGRPVAAKYHGAEHEAQVGGDFYEVLDTPSGLRLVLGDVRGKGLAAVRLSNYATGAFREAARSGGDLRDIVIAMNQALVLDGGPEDFATAVVAEVRGNTLWAVSCGHPGPVLLRGGRLEWLEPPIDVPLGLGAGSVAAAPIATGTGQVLLITDGLLEARDRRGRFFDADAALTRILRDSGDTCPPGPVLLDAVAAAVRRHAGHLRDDVALLTLKLG